MPRILAPVPVGPSTKAGLWTTFLAFAAALIAALSGDSTPETLMAVGVGLVSLVSVIMSRAAQAIAAAKAPAAPSASNAISTGWLSPPPPPPPPSPRLVPTPDAPGPVPHE